MLKQKRQITLHLRFFQLAFKWWCCCFDFYLLKYFFTKSCNTFFWENYVNFLCVVKGTSKTMSVNALHKHKEQQAICHHSCACFMNFFVIRCDSKQCCQAFHAVNGHDQANAWPQDAIHHGGCTPNHAHCCRSGIILGLSRVLLNQSADKMPSLSFGLGRMQQLMSLVLSKCLVVGWPFN